MVWPLIAAGAGMQLGKGLAGWLTRPKIPRAEQTARGRELMRRSRYGAYGPVAQRNILSAAGRASGAAGQTARVGIRGGLVHRGMGDSIAGERLLAEPGLRRSRYLAETGERLGTENELAKTEARSDFATLQDQMDATRRESRRQGLQSLLGGGLGAVEAGVGTYMQEKTLGEFEDFNRKYAQIDLLIQAGNFEEAERLLAELTGGMPLDISTTRGLHRPAVPPQEKVLQAGRY